ncbi:beta family protein [Thermosediminibacter litoriperuensis]|uniref:T4 beta protein n=1 Tax=Thermosediminibacter litoriperuensis TaxID=291989 RepID=A0A5S5AV85_9FIRM|nr:hypothetical protein [Thermosediminibacter litoriperuensis]TYP56813.1 T4 beta protein [Thermosediminibacter litoriperuensis]
MSNKKCYVPVLKWKKGEQEALKNLTSDQKTKIIPLIEITDYQDPISILKSLHSCYANPIFIDTIIAAEDDRDFLLSIVRESKENNQQVFPVFYFDDFPEVIKPFIEYVEHIGIRVPIPEDIEGPSYEELFKTIKEFKDNNNILIDIILDLNVITDRKEANRQLSEVKNVIQNFLLNRSFYNSIIISSTSLPESISSVPAGGQASFLRYDIMLFKRIYEFPMFDGIKNKLIYSDYGVTKFTDTEIDFSRIKYILPKIKYTTYNEYLVLKGQKDNRTKETIKGYVDLSKEILSSKYYFGENFSFGDLEIKERAYGLNGKGPGSNTNWVTIAANHHIAVVVEQLSKFFGI